MFSYEYQPGDPRSRGFPTYGLGFPSFNPINSALMDNLTKVVGPVGQFLPTSDPNKVPYLGMVTTGNGQQLHLVDAPMNTLIIGLDFAKKAAPLFALVNVKEIQPGEKTATYQIVSVGASPWQETAPLVPGPKGSLKISEMKVQTNRFAHMTQIEAISLEKTREGKMQNALMNEQQVQGLLATLAAVIIGGIVAHVPPSLPFGVAGVNQMRSSPRIKLADGIQYIINCWGAFGKGDGVPYLMGVVNQEKSAREIAGSFVDMLTDEGCLYALMRLHNNMVLEGIKDYNSISQVKVLVEKLMGLKITEVASFPLAAGAKSYHPLRTPNVRTLHYMLYRYSAGGRIVCYDRKYDIFEKNIPMPTHDSFGDACNNGEWFILIRPSVYETGNAVMISDANRPELFMSEVVTRSGVNVQQLSFTSHSVIFAGLAVPNPDGLLGAPNVRIISHVKGDGVQVTVGGGANHVPASRDFFDLDAGDALCLPIEDPNGVADADPRNFPFLHPSGQFPPGAGRDAPQITYRVAGAAAFSADINAHTAPLVQTATVTRTPRDRMMPPFMLLDSYRVVPGPIAAGGNVEVDVPGNPLWGQPFPRMMAKILMRAEAWMGRPRD